MTQQTNPVNIKFLSIQAQDFIEESVNHGRHGSSLHS